MEEKNKELLFKSIDKYKATHDESEFNTIYSMIVNELTAHIATYSRTTGHGYNEDDVLEITQQTMVKIWKGLDSLSDSKTFFKWMNVTADRTCLDFWSKAAYTHEVSASDFTITTDDDEDSNISQDDLFNTFDANDELMALNMNELTDIVSTCMNVLDDSTQEIVQMKFFDGLGYAEIAKQTGISETALRQRVSRGKAKLGEAMEAEAKKRGFKLYNVSFFSLFLFLHSKLSGRACEETKVLLAGGHFDKLITAVTSKNVETAVGATGKTVAKYVPFFATRVGKAVVAGCVAVGIAGGTAIGVTNAKKSETNAEEQSAEVTTSSPDSSSDMSYVITSEPKVNAKYFTAEANGKEVNSDFNPLNYIIVKDPDGNEIELTRESKKKYTYDCNAYSAVATYEDRKLSDDGRTLSATIVLTVTDKSSDSDATQMKKNVSFTVKTSDESSAGGASTSKTTQSNNIIFSNANSSNSSSSSSSASSSSSNTATVHEHSWTPVYATRTVQTGTVHHDAIYETQSYVLTAGGREFATVDEWSAWSKSVANATTAKIYAGMSAEQALAEEEPTNYSIQTRQVLVSEAYDEPVYGEESYIGHYVCNGCGATK